jgi:hypothetical protein
LRTFADDEFYKGSAKTSAVQGWMNGAAFPTVGLLTMKNYERYQVRILFVSFVCLSLFVYAVPFLRSPPLGY